jgi:hypothetical protein
MDPDQGAIVVDLDGAHRRGRKWERRGALSDARILASRRGSVIVQAYWPIMS